MRNIGKVFKYTFLNLVKNSKYIAFTIILSLALLCLPSIVVLIMTANKEEESEGIEECGFNKVAVVNEINDEEIDYNIFNTFGEEKYSNIEYVTAKNVDEAIADNDVVLRFFLSEDTICTDLIVSNDLKGGFMSHTDVENYNEFLSAYSSQVSIVVLGIDEEKLVQLSIGSNAQRYSEEGIKENITIEEENEEVRNNEIIKNLKFFIPYIVIMFMYFFILFTGQSVALSLVVEKENKLMDTMLVTVKPLALVYGKTFGAICSTLLQMLSWIVSLIAGLGIARIVAKEMNEEFSNTVEGFVNGISEMNILQPIYIVGAVLLLFLGIVLYVSLSAVAGAMSSTKEEATSKNGVFIYVLIISFMVTMFGGGLGANSIPIWMCIIPFISVLVSPGYMLLGILSPIEAILAVITTVLVTLGVLYLAGKMYKMMSLYKGNKVSIKKAFQMLFQNK